MESIFDREYYIAATCDKFYSDEFDLDEFLEAANKAIDKTLKAYTKNGKLLVEDWNMFDQDLYSNTSDELDKL